MAIRAEAEDWIDGLKVAKLTTWTPEKKPELDAAPYDPSEIIPDRIDFLFRGNLIKS